MNKIIIIQTPQINQYKLNPAHQQQITPLIMNQKQITTPPIINQQQTIPLITLPNRTVPINDQIGQPNIYQQQIIYPNIYQQQIVQPNLYQQQIAQPNNIYQQQTDQTKNIYQQQTGQPNNNIYQHQTGQSNTYHEQANQPNIYQDKAGQPNLYQEQTDQLNIHQEQKQLVISRQEVAQKLDLEYNIYALGRALSKAELYAFRFGDPKKKDGVIPKFGYYNQFNNGYNFDDKKLFKSLVNAVKFVHYGFEETEYKFEKKFIFPGNMTKDEVINYINELKEFLNKDEEKKIYDDLINVINRIDIEFSGYDKLYNRNTKIDPKKLMESYPRIFKVFQAKEEMWKKRIENDPNYNPEFMLEKDFDDNSEFREYYLQLLDFK